MRFARSATALAAVTVLAACAADVPTAAAPAADAPRASRASRSGGPSDVNQALAAARAATARYHDVARAEADGYRSTVDCVAIPGAAMGVHYVNSALFDDGVLDPTRPEVLVYEPRANDRLRLVAVEYLIPRPVWDGPNPGTRPTLFGATFQDGPMNTYALHAWVWRHNPAGTFAAFNAQVTCPAGDAGDARH